MPSRFHVELTDANWKLFHWRLAARRMPAIVILLAVAVSVHQTAAGVLAGGAALSVGFAAARQVEGSRLLAMIATACGMTVCALAGTIAGNSYPVTLGCAFGGGFGCGFLALASEDAGWVAMQGVIAFLIGTSFASSWVHAAERAACILSGGIVQTLSISLIWYREGITRFGPELTGGKDEIRKSENWRALFERAVRSPVCLRFGLRVAITLAAAVELDHLLRLKNGYWLPMTALIVLKPDFLRTYTGGIQRVAGTLAGVVFASAVAAIFYPGPVALIVLVVAAGWLAFSSQNVNPIVFSAALTSYVVFLIAIAGLPESSVTWHRLINTVLGCILALVSHFLGFFVIHRATGRSDNFPNNHGIRKAP